MASAFLKYFLVLPALKWLADEKNQDKVVTGLKALHTIFKFIADIAKFSFVNTIEGLYDLLKEDATWQERIGGLGRALVGLGTGLLAIRWLTNPTKIITDFTSTLRYFHTSLKGGHGKLMKIASRLGLAGAVATGAILATSQPAGQGSSLTSAMDATGKLPGDEGYDKETAGTVTIETLEKIRPDLVEDRKAELGMSRGGFLPEFAKGGWISGPQSGYPVNITGGSKPDFIGHGTEYVARKADGGAFIVPFSTPATKSNPGLTSQRINEAKANGIQFARILSGW